MSISKYLWAATAMVAAFFSSLCAITPAQI
jgi:hypothetical protein